MKNWERLTCCTMRLNFSNQLLQQQLKHRRQHPRNCRKLQALYSTYQGQIVDEANFNPIASLFGEATPALPAPESPSKHYSLIPTKV